MTEHTPADRFRQASDDFAARLHAVPPDAWERPSPCAGWTARDVVDHIVEWVPPFMESIEVPVDPGPAVADDPAAAWDHVAAQVQATLDDPAKAGREVVHPHLGTTTVAAAVSTAVTGDVVLHTWDVARATGGDERLPADVVHEMLIGMEPIVDTLVASGHFGPPLPVGPDADEQTRLLAITGRRV